MTERRGNVGREPVANLVFRCPAPPRRPSSHHASSRASERLSDPPIDAFARRRLVQPPQAKAEPRRQPFAVQAHENDRGKEHTEPRACGVFCIAFQELLSTDPTNANVTAAPA